jgi:secretion/DNA translocation related CpaE-like protein
VRVSLDTVRGVEAPEDCSSRALIVTTDESLLDDLLRLPAAAARRSWAAAGIVVVGADVAGAVSEMRLPRREGVVLTARRATDTRMWTHAVAIGAGEVLTLPEAQTTLIDLFGDCLEGGARGGSVVSVIGGCGGSGATTFAAALAMTSARRRQPTLVIDADPLGGGIDLVLGSEHDAGLRWPDLAGTSGRLSATTLRDALPRTGELWMLSWDRGSRLPVTAGAMRSVMSAGQRGHELVVVDLPRHLDAAAEEAVVRSAVTLLVVPAEVRAVAAASRVLAGVRALAPRVGLVVRGPGPSGLDAEEIGESLGVTAWALMRADKSLGQALDEGLGPLRRRRGPLATCCAQVLDRLAVRAAAA